MSKFAPITANFLVRKGEAAPSLASKRIFDWAREPAAPSFRVAEAASDEAAAELLPCSEQTCSPELPDIGDVRKTRRLVLTLTAAEFERLGIAAAKKGGTRHELVQATMRKFFSEFSRELNGTCLCLSLAEGSRCQQVASSDH